MSKESVSRVAWSWGDGSTCVSSWDAGDTLNQRNLFFKAWNLESSFMMLAHPTATQSMRDFQLPLKVEFAVEAAVAAGVLLGS